MTVRKINPIRFIIYFFWLSVRIVRSAVYVSRIALLDNELVDPSVVWFRADYDNPAACSMLAGSISLRPGTLMTKYTSDGIFSVHTLTRELRENLLDGSMQVKVAWLYGDAVDFRLLGPDEIPGQKASGGAGRKKKRNRRKKKIYAE